MARTGYVEPSRATPRPKDWQSGVPGATICPA